jgi:hypothetical protein
VSAVMADHPRAYYRLDDASGATMFHDSSGNGQDAQVMVTGQIDADRPGALSDDAATHFAADENHEAWAIFPVWPTWSGDFTVELFVRALAPPSNQFAASIVICERYLQSGFRFGWIPGFDAQVWTAESGGNGSVETSWPLGTAIWTHVAFVHRNTTSELYINGALAGTSSTMSYVPPGGSAQCGFGAFHGLPTDGDLDELAVYDAALTQAQLTAHVAAAR